LRSTSENDALLLGIAGRCDTSNTTELEEVEELAGEEEAGE
jgi:hypothetical protein